jgi:hypothetical protein
MRNSKQLYPANQTGAGGNNKENYSEAQEQSVW